MDENVRSGRLSLENDRGIFDEEVSMACYQLRHSFVVVR